MGVAQSKSSSTEARYLSSSIKHIIWSKRAFLGCNTQHATRNMPGRIGLYRPASPAANHRRRWAGRARTLSPHCKPHAVRGGTTSDQRASRVLSAYAPGTNHTPTTHPWIWIRGMVPACEAGLARSWLDANCKKPNLHRGAAAARMMQLDGAGRVTRQRELASARTDESCVTVQK